MASLYDELGIKPVINASATLTRLGGSRMPTEVVDAMNAAAHAFVDLNELQEKVGARIAELTQNEACYVASGAAAGIMLAVASCIAGTDPANRALQYKVYQRKYENALVLYKPLSYTRGQAGTTCTAAMREFGLPLAAKGG